MSQLFTIEEGITVQQNQLHQWADKLSAACYIALHDWLEERNKDLDPTKHDGYDVARGEDLVRFICNWSSK